MKLNHSLLLLVLVINCTHRESEGIIESDTTVYYKSDSLHAVVFKPNHRFNFGSDGSISVLELGDIRANEGWTPAYYDLLSFRKTLKEYIWDYQQDSLHSFDLGRSWRYEYLDSLEYQFIGYIDSIGFKNLYVNYGIFEGSDLIDWKEMWYFSDHFNFPTYFVDEDSIVFSY